MSPWQTFEHTADVGIEARGGSLAELFASAAEGMMALLIDPATVRATEHRRVTLTADDFEGLLVDWLNELLVLLNAESFVPAAVDVTDVTDAHVLTADVAGEPVDPARHKFRMDIKAATYHQVRVSRNDEWNARVILDV